MDAPKGPAAPESGNDDLPTFEELAADPEIAALLDFEPAPRKNKRKDGWTPALQKRFVALLAYTGSLNKAAEALGKNRHGVEKVYKSEGADAFRAAWDGAIELVHRARRRTHCAGACADRGCAPAIRRRTAQAAFNASRYRARS